MWRALDVGMGQVVHIKVPYLVGACKAPAGPCPMPVSANQVSMSPVVAPGHDAALMEFEEDSSDFFFEQDSGDDVDSFPVVHWDSSVVKSHAPDPPLSEGDEVEVKPEQAEVCGVVPPLVVWEELFNASEDYFANGSGGTDSEKAPVEVAPLPVGFPVSGVYRPAPSGTLLVLLAFVSLLVAVGVTGFLCAVFG